MAYDIFISYRRTGGKEFARPLQLELERRGYRVFLDFDELKDGVFDRRIMEAIDSAPIFLVVLSPHALDRCADAGDWVRKEIEYAIQKKRHFVPVNPDLTSDGLPDWLPETLKTGLGQHQFSEVMFGQLFKESVEKMVRDRIEPLLSKIDRVVDGHSQKQVGALFHVETDMECRILKFGREIAVARPGEDVTIRLPKGRHKLEFVSTECPDDRLSMTCTVEDVDMEDFIEIELVPVRERREAEEAARQAEAERKRIIDMFEMVYVEGGTFMMGARDSDSDARSAEKPAHCVTLSGYYISKYPVTEVQLDKFSNTRLILDPTHYYKPATRVSWNDVQEFIRKLNTLTGKNYRLPTEAEWEFAARGGNKSRGYKYSGSNNIDDVAWYNNDDKYKYTRNVGKKLPNELGIYDMSGNVWEWCQDWFGGYSSSAQTNPTGPSSGEERVLRGGDYSSDARRCRVVHRAGASPNGAGRNVGFRLVLSE